VLCVNYETQQARQDVEMSLNFQKRSQSGWPDYLTGFVLVGGTSKRMGQSKASLLIDGEKMLHRQIRLLRTVARRVVVVGGATDYMGRFDVPVVPDELPGRGPLAGIYTALLKSRTEFNIVLGCDLPFVNGRMLAFLVGRAMNSGSDVTVPCSRDGRPQPLCAVYRRRALYAVRTRLALGANKISGFFPMVHCNAIPWREVAGAGFTPSVFDNMNTPEEYEYVRKRIEASQAASV
jgi:molybdopterin-guanine dinucleotide biosynthesis protein A